MIDWIKAWYHTILILCQPKLMRDIREAEKEYERGEAIEWTRDMP